MQAILYWRKPVLDFNRYEWISFDCYGTLVDWETGISDAVATVFAAHGVLKSREDILALFSEAEPQVQASGEFLDYRRVLRDVMQIMAWEAGIRLPAAEADALADSLPRWPVFPDVPGALHDLKKHYKLAVISNVDNDLFRCSEEALGITFHAVATSQEEGCYKPDLRVFYLAQERLGLEGDGDLDRWLHVGESLYHDIGPANRLGIASVWVNRLDRGGGSRRTDAVPSLEVPDLAELARLMLSK